MNLCDPMIDPHNQAAYLRREIRRLHGLIADAVDIHYRRILGDFEASMSALDAEVDRAVRQRMREATENLPTVDQPLENDGKN